jgi:hypothetical protein
MKKLTVMAASMALAVATVVPAFAQVPPSTTTGAQKVTAGQVKTVPTKAQSSIYATTKKVAIKKIVKKPVIKKMVRKAPAKVTPPASATSPVR